MLELSAVLAVLALLCAVLAEKDRIDTSQRQSRGAALDDVFRILLAKRREYTSRGWAFLLAVRIISAALLGLLIVQFVMA